MTTEEGNENIGDNKQDAVIIFQNSYAWIRRETCGVIRTTEDECEWHDKVSLECQEDNSAQMTSAGECRAGELSDAHPGAGFSGLLQGQSGPAALYEVFVN